MGGRPRRGIGLALLAPAVLVALLPPLLDCGSTAETRCPLIVPTDKAFCNSGGVVVYCHYDCVADASTSYYAICSGPRWQVVASGLQQLGRSLLSNFCPRHLDIVNQPVIGDTCDRMHQ